MRNFFYLYFFLSEGSTPAKPCGSIRPSIPPMPAKPTAWANQSYWKNQILRWNTTITGNWVERKNSVRFWSLPGVRRLPQLTHIKSKNECFSPTCVSSSYLILYRDDDDARSAITSFQWSTRRKNNIRGAFYNTYVHLNDFGVEEFLIRPSD